jgi:indolepyruvate ferredoxin oxidoreductase beta subunit
MSSLIKDPLNLIVAGVGGQGNLRVAEIIGRSLIKTGYIVAIGDTLGGAQRGGSVASQIRISRLKRYGPYIPEGQAHIILGMEPIETLRVLAKYGSQETAVISNNRPISSLDLFGKRVKYPPVGVVIESIRKMAGKVWIIDAVNEALQIGKPVYANMILIGALSGTGLVPLNAADVEEQLEGLSSEEINANLKALHRGIDLLKDSKH